MLFITVESSFSILKVNIGQQDEKSICFAVIQPTLLGRRETPETDCRMSRRMERGERGGGGGVERDEY